MTVTWPDVITGSHRLVFEARVLESFQTGDDPDGTEIMLNDGEVAFDSSTQKIYSTCDVETFESDGQLGPSLWPRGRSRLLAPFGNELFIRIGVDLGGAGVLWQPLGYFVIEQVRMRVEATIRVTGSDRMLPVDTSDLVSPRVYGPATTVSRVFDDLVKEILPEATILFDDDTGDAPLGREIIAERSRLDPLIELVDAYGKVMFWDELGFLRVEDPPDPDVVVWDVRSGSGGVLVEPTRDLSRKGIFNAVVVEGEGGDTQDPVRAIAYDNDPTSPTRYGGPLGRIPMFFTTPLVTTYPQAANAAAALLRQSIGAPYNMDLNVITNAQLRPRQAIRVTQQDGNRDIMVVEQVTIPLDAEQSMSARMKEKAIIVVGGV